MSHQATSLSMSHQGTSPSKDDSFSSDSEGEDEVDDGMCDYERLREKNIARNNARLLMLGLVFNDDRETKKVPASPPKKVTTVPQSHSARRSKRISNEGEVPSASHSEMHSNDDFCFICKNEGGILIYCDKCVKAFHEECMGLDSDLLPDTWFCPSCCTGEPSEGGLPSAPSLVMQLKKHAVGIIIGLLLRKAVF